MKLKVFQIILPLFWCLKSLAMPVEQDAVTDVAEATPFPDLKKSFVDIKNVSPEVSIILKDYNVSLVSILQQQQELQNKTRYVTPTPTFPPPTAPKE